MLPVATIVFREVLEIALVLTIVLAATRGLQGRIGLVLAGLGIGVAGSAVIAFFTDSIAMAMDGVGQEIFNACIMFVAVAFLAWTVIWMKVHGRQMAQQIKQVGADVVAGKRSMYAIVAIIAVATLREGAEIVLFTYSMVASGSVTMATILSGAGIGFIGGTVAGGLLYYGLLKAAQKHLFTVTSWMLILLTAGMAAQGAAFLAAADVLPVLVPQLWDTSSLLSGDSLLGETLGVLVGYTPTPGGIELAFYLTALGGIGLAYNQVGRKSMQRTTA